MSYENDPRVLEVVEKVRALQQLTEQTGVFTKKSQGHILQALDPERLAAAAKILTEAGRQAYGDSNRIHNHTTNK